MAHPARAGGALAPNDGNRVRCDERIGNFARGVSFDVALVALDLEAAGRELVVEHARETEIARRVADENFQTDLPGFTAAPMCCVFQ